MEVYCLSKGIEHQFSAPYEPKQNGVAERKNRTLIEAARTMLADSRLPTMFWGEAVNTACHVLNRVLIVKRFNKTPYELLNNRKPNLAYLEPFGVPCTFLKVRNQGKFDEKAEEGLFLGYIPGTPNRRVYNVRTEIVDIGYNVVISSHTHPVHRGSDVIFNYDDVFTSFNGPITFGAGSSKVDDVVLLRNEDIGFIPSTSTDSAVGTSTEGDEIAKNGETDQVNDFAQEPEDGKSGDKDTGMSGSPVVEPSTPLSSEKDDEVPALEDQTQHPFMGDQGEIGSNLGENLQVDKVPQHRVNIDHPSENIIGDAASTLKTRNQLKRFSGLFVDMSDSGILDTCQYSCFISQQEPKNVQMALKEPSWVEAMQEELGQFEKLQVWELVDLPVGEHAIGTRWVFKCKRDDKGVVVRNKAMLVVQGFAQQEGLDYTEVFAPVARLEAIRLFLAFASYKNIKVYQLDVKSAFLYGKVQELVFVAQPPGFEDPDQPNRVYRLNKALYGLHQAPRAWYEKLSKHFLDNGFERGQIDSTLFIKWRGN